MDWIGWPVMGLIHTIVRAGLISNIPPTSKKHLEPQRVPRDYHWKLWYVRSWPSVLVMLMLSCNAGPITYVLVEWL